MIKVYGSDEVVLWYHQNSFLDLLLLYSCILTIHPILNGTVQFYGSVLVSQWIFLGHLFLSNQHSNIFRLLEIDYIMGHRHMVAANRSHCLQCSQCRWYENWCFLCSAWHCANVCVIYCVFYLWTLGLRLVCSHCIMAEMQFEAIDIADLILRCREVCIIDVTLLFRFINMMISD